MRDEEARLQALTNLALRTKEKVQRAVYVLYLQDTARFPSAVVIEACERWGTSSKWWPSASELIEECVLVGRRHQERAEERARKRLPPAPVPQEKLDAFMAQFRAVIRKKAMR